MSEERNRWDDWETTIRDPAERTKEGIRRLDCGSATAEYQVSSLPDGRVAIRIKCNLEFVTGMSIPWRAFGTREEAVTFFQEQALAFFKREDRLRADREKARRKIMGLLEGDGLFGFQEPEPEAS